MLLDCFLNPGIVVAGISKTLAHDARQGRSVERRKDRPITTRRTERLLEAFERIARLRWERCFFVGLALPEHDERPGLEVEVTPTNPASPFVVRITEHLGPADARVGEQRGERAIAELFDRTQSLLVDGRVSLLVEMGQECFPISPTPELLTIVPRSRIREFLLGAAFPRRVFSEEFLVDTPAQEGLSYWPTLVVRIAVLTALIDLERIVPPDMELGTTLGFSISSDLPSESTEVVAFAELCDSLSVSEKGARIEASGSLCTSRGAYQSDPRRDPTRKY